MKNDCKTCPFCKENIRQEAVKCRFCGEWLEKPIASSTKENFVENSESSQTQKPNSSKDLVASKKQYGFSKKILVVISFLLLVPSCLYLAWGLISVDWNRVNPNVGADLIIGTVKIFIAPTLICWWKKGRIQKLFAFSVCLAAVTLLAAYYAHNASIQAQQKSQESNALQIDK